MLCATLHNFVLISPSHAVPTVPKDRNSVTLETRSNNHKPSDPLSHLLGMCLAKLDNGIKRGWMEQVKWLYHLLFSGQNGQHVTLSFLLFDGPLAPSHCIQSTTTVMAARPPLPICLHLFCLLFLILISLRYFPTNTFPTLLPSVSHSHLCLSPSTSLCSSPPICSKHFRVYRFMSSSPIWRWQLFPNAYFNALLSISMSLVFSSSSLVNITVWFRFAFLFSSVSWIIFKQS